MKFSIVMVALSFFSLSCMAQAPKESVNQKEDYLLVVNKRSEKIVATLGITDSSKFLRVRAIIAMQYRNLNDIQTIQENKIRVIKQKTNVDKTELDKEIKFVGDETMRQSDSLHKIYLARLGKELNNQQIEKVKDGMTYGVLPITYKGYQEMLPDLTKEQKAQILVYLTEAREKAIRTIGFI